MHIDEIIDRLYKIPGQSKTEIMANITEVTYPKGKVLLEAGTAETNVYFIMEGLGRAYAPIGDRQVTFWFGKEEDTVLSRKSHIGHQKGYEDIQVLEDCTLFRLKAAHLKGLFPFKFYRIYLVFVVSGNGKENYPGRAGEVQAGVLFQELEPAYCLHVGIGEDEVRASTAVSPAGAFPS